MALCSAALLAGCGDSSDQDEALSAVGTYQEAFASKDGAAVCASLTRRTRNAVVSQLEALGPSGLRDLAALTNGPREDCGTLMDTLFGIVPAGDFERARKAHAHLSSDDISISGSTATVALSPGDSLTLVKTGDRWLVTGSNFGAIEPMPAEAVIDPEKVERNLDKELTRQLGRAVDSVACPSGQPVRPGKTFTCEVEYADGGTSIATLKILNRSPDLSLIKLREVNKAT